MIFSKETIRVVSIPKLGKFIAAFGRYRLKSPFLAKKVFLGTKTPRGVPKYFDQNFFSWSSKWYGDLTSCKKSEKNIERSRL